MESETRPMRYGMFVHWTYRVDVHSFLLGARSATASATLPLSLTSWTRWGRPSGEPGKLTP